MSFIFSNPNINIATHGDVVPVRDLLNTAYRGEESKKGWTTEADLIAGNVRADEKIIREAMTAPGSVVLKYINDAGLIIGCVNLQQHVTRVYLGMFSVSPQLQGAGIGKQLLKASEEYTKHLQCSSIYMSVISVRDELINWYKRHGYVDTDERKPFTEDGITGKHLQKLEFMILEKSLC